MAIVAPCAHPVNWNSFGCRHPCSAINSPEMDEPAPAPSPPQGRVRSAANESSLPPVPGGTRSWPATDKGKSLLSTDFSTSDLARFSVWRMVALPAKAVKTRSGRTKVKVPQFRLLQESSPSRIGRGASFARFQLRYGPPFALRAFVQREGAFFGRELFRELLFDRKGKATAWLSSPVIVRYFKTSLRAKKAHGSSLSTAILAW